MPTKPQFIAHKVLLGILLTLGGLPVLPTQAFAFEFLPESGHQRFQTFGLFIEDQTTLIQQSGSRAWGALGTSIALFGLGSDTSSSQFVLTASVNTAFRLSQSLDPETADARVSLKWETALSSDWLLSFGFSHASGHVNDDVIDKDLEALNVGIETFPLRIIYTGSEHFRPGLTFQPLFGSEPKTKGVQANQFLEIYPWGTSSEFRRGTPYLALGVEEYGHNKIDLSGHAQIGAYFGNHVQNKRFNSLRIVLGGYSGQDPRLKYYYYKDTRAKFAYAGLMFDI